METSITSDAEKSRPLCLSFVKRRLYRITTAEVDFSQEAILASAAFSTPLAVFFRILLNVVHQRPLLLEHALLPR
ncbi:MAG: hypothetical protein JW388_0682 [Nitrospira sp.]|nr:hypothetical protein [Nitrospira sp.]